MRTLITGANVVLPDEVHSNLAVLIEGERIAALDPQTSAGAQRVDLSGFTLMPGLVDLHGDALEKEVEPRPNVHFPLDFACAAIDRRCAAAGITTAYHALSFAHHELGVRNNAFAADIARAVRTWQPHALIDNRVHARYEITDGEAPEILVGLIEQGAVDLLSFMDHSPGQGQFRDAEAYREYLARTYGTEAHTFAAILARKTQGATGAYARMQTLATLARKRDIPLASHDDDTPERTALVADLGARISEFPVDLATARAARAQGMMTLFGAPNLLRGRSQSGHLRAIDAVRAGVADCLCSDYAPTTLIAAVFKLAETGEMTLPGAARLVTANPARAAGLADRGQIAVGLRADLIAVGRHGGWPQVAQVWSAGQTVYAVQFKAGSSPPPVTNRP